jgi:DNA-binding NarL/FixJ family response regulator
MPADAEGNGTAKLTESSLPAGRFARTVPLRIALIDPKPLTRRSIGEMLAKVFPDYATLAASSCEELLETRGELSGCLVIIYIRSAGVADAWVQNTLELLRLRVADAPVIVLSDCDEVDDIRRALDWGVRGYIPTSLEVKVASAALKLVNAGGIFIPAHVLRSATAEAATGIDGEWRGHPNKLDLTSRELAVIDLLREGKPNKLIAIELNMQESTAKVHVRNIMKKLGANNRTHAAGIANRILGEPVATTVALPGPNSDNGSMLIGSSR